MKSGHEAGHLVTTFTPVPLRKLAPGYQKLLAIDGGQVHQIAQTPYMKNRNTKSHSTICVDR